MVDDDPTARRLMRYWLENAGYEVLEAATAGAAEALIEKRPALACVDLGLGPSSGIEVIRRLMAADSSLTAIVVTAQKEVESAVGAMRAGAYDYVTKPLDPTRLLQAVARAAERHEYLSTLRDGGFPGVRLLEGPLGGKSQRIVDLERQVRRVVDRDVAITLSGENGVGKGHLARAIHEGSARRSAPFFTLDCAVVEPSEQEALLFGKESGGTVRGILEQASGGVLYLDHVECLALSVQTALSALLAGGAVHRAQSASEFSTNVRLVAGTTRDLRALVERGTFSEELFFRLVVYPIEVPALRDRKEDLPWLVGHYLRELSSRMGGRSVRSVDPEVLEALSAHNWPGNLRELENVIQRGMLSAAEDTLSLADLPAEFRNVPPSERRPAEARQSASAFAFPENEVVPLRELERLAIEHALRVTNGSVSLAAKRLGIGRATLYRRIASLDLSENVA